MGCCSSASEAVQSRPVAMPYIQQNQNVQLFLLGSANGNKPLFYAFNPATQKLKKMIGPENFQPMNHSCMILIDANKYAITGGIDANLTQISNQCHIYNVSTNTVSKMACMKQRRYTHNSVYLNGYLYVFGGRQFGDDNQAILDHCQRLNILDNQWQVLPKLNEKRCTAFSAVWNGNIYVYGGYQQQFLRPMSFEVFNVKKLKWEISELQLNRGLQSSIAISNNYNQLTIFGGLTNSGPTDKVITINFKQNKIRSNLSLKTEKVLGKFIQYQNNLLILGGQDKLLLQTYNMLTQQSSIKDIGLSKYFNNDTFESLTYSQKTIQIPFSSQPSNQRQISDGDQIVFIFGTTWEPFVLQFNISIPSINIAGIPTNLKLHCQQGGLHIGKNNFIIFGGIEDSLQQVSAETFIYDYKNNKVKKCTDMYTPRYAFAYQKINKQIYALGGGSTNQEGQLIILKSCERFSLLNNQWATIADLPIQVISPMSLVHKNNLYVFGGMQKDKQKNKNIIKYDFNKNTWNKLPFVFPFGIEGGSIFKNNESQFYILGGRLANGDTDGIWSLQFINPNSNEEDCIFTEKGRMNEKKCLHKVYTPKNYDFMVIFGGKKNLLSCYDRNTLDLIDGDALAGVKQLFLEGIKGLNEKSMKNFLIVINN